MKRWRIFWSCEVCQSGDGYYYHRWKNYFWGIEKDIFAGYQKMTMRSRKSTFEDVLQNLE